MHDLSCKLVHARGELAICTGELANVYKQNENMVMELAEAREQVAHANKYNEEKSKELDTAHEQQRCMSLEIADLQDQLKRLLEYNWALREELDVIMDPEDLLIKTAEIAFTSAIRQTVGLHSVLDCALSVSMVSDKPWPVDVPCISVGDESVDYTNGDLVGLVKTECRLYEKQSEPLYWKLRHAVMLAEDFLGQGWEKRDIRSHDICRLAETLDEREDAEEVPDEVLEGWLQAGGGEYKFLHAARDGLLEFKFGEIVDPSGFSISSFDTLEEAVGYMQDSHFPEFRFENVKAMFIIEDERSASMANDKKI
jgi:hypothetical protein